VKEIAGIVGWNRPGGMAFGAATSLYERHPISGDTAGNPVADVLQNTPYISIYLFIIF